MPRDLETICLKCLEKEPGKRYATAQEVADQLERLLRHEPIHARAITRAGATVALVPAQTGDVKPGGALLFAILFGTTAIAWQLRRVAQAAQSLRARVYASDVNAAFHALTQTVPRPGDRRCSKGTFRSAG